MSGIRRKRINSKSEESYGGFVVLPYFNGRLLKIRLTAFRSLLD
jgi:hypothetical protein